MFCKIVRHVDEAYFSDKVKSFLLDVIFYPVKSMSNVFESFWCMADVSIPLEAELSV